MGGANYDDKKHTEPAAAPATGEPAVTTPEPAAPPDQEAPAQDAAEGSQEVSVR